MTKKSLSKKQIILIVIAIVAGAMVVATAITLPIVLTNDGITVPTPQIKEFDQVSDMSVEITWNSIKRALSYDIEYCFGNPLTAEKIFQANTTNTKFSLQRKKGILSYRVRASFDDRYGAFSEWQFFDISALSLSAPTVSISNTLLVTWTAVRYGYDSNRKNAPSYLLELYIEDNLTSSNIYVTNSLSYDFSSYVVTMIVKGKVWEDVVFKIRVKALNYYKVPLIGSVVTDGEYEFLYGAYEESEFGEREITVTETMYDDITDRYLQG